VERDTVQASEVSSRRHDDYEAGRGVFYFAYAPTAVRFAEPGFPKRHVHIREFDGSLLGQI
jgi:hypothetical protein